MNTKRLFTSKARFPFLLSITGRLFGFAASIVVARELGATDFATYALWLLLLEMLGYANLGLPTVLFRNLSMASKSGVEQGQQTIINLAISTSILLNLFCFSIMFFAYRWDMLPISLSAVEFTLLLLARSMSVYLAINKNIAKGKGLITSTAWLEATNATFMPVLNVALVVYFNLIGVMVANIIMSLLSLATLKMNKLSYSWNFEFHYIKIKALLKISVPLYLAVTFETLLITLPILLAGYSVEALSLGAFIYVFQNTKPERIPLFAYFTTVSYRELLIAAAEDPFYRTKGQWSRVSILLRRYFLTTIILSMAFFILINTITRTFLEEYIGQLWLLEFTIPALSFFALRRIFNAHFTATGKLWERTRIYLFAVIVTGLMYSIFRDANFISTTVLAIWISCSVFVTGMAGYVRFLRDTGGSVKVVIREISFVICSLLASLICINWLLKMSMIIFDVTQNSMFWLLSFSVISYLVYVAFLIIIFLLIFSKNEFLSIVDFQNVEQK